MITVNGIKLTDIKYNDLKKEFSVHNKNARKTNQHFLIFRTFDEYISYRFGTKKYRPAFKEMKVSSKKTSVKHIPSLSFPTKEKPLCNKTENPIYTGDYIVGIATMHKSNAVPVSRNDNPVDYSTMRRS